MSYRDLQLPVIGGHYVIHLPPSWIYSVTVIDIVYNEERPEQSLYTLQAVWSERIHDHTDLALSQNPGQAPGLTRHPATILRVRDAWISHALEAHASLVTP